MYELEYKPERLDWNEYFIRFKETGDIKSFFTFMSLCWIEKQGVLLNITSYRIPGRRI